MSPRLLVVLLTLLPAASGAARASEWSAAPASADPLLVALTASLASLPPPESELVLAFARPAPAGLTAENFTVLDAPRQLTPQFLLRVRHPAPDGRTSVDSTLVLTAQLLRDGWTARAPAPRGEPVDFLRLEPTRYDALRDRDALPFDPALDLLYARPVAAGRLLTWRDVSRRPLVRRGESIEVAATDGTLSVILRAVALNDAGRGETVRVRNPDSRREFTAEVTGEARATVRF